MALQFLINAATNLKLGLKDNYFLLLSFKYNIKEYFFLYNINNNINKNMQPI